MVITNHADMIITNHADMIITNHSDMIITNQVLKGSAISLYGGYTECTLSIAASEI